MFEVVGQDIISGNMGFIGTDSDRLYCMGAAEKTEDITVTGNPAVLDNATGKPFKELHIYGRSEQMTTTGAQLLDFSDLIGKTETKNGATYKINEDQSITVSGTPTEYTSFYLKAMSLKAGSYYFLRNSDDKVFVQLISAKADMNNGFTLDEDADGIGVYVVFNVASNNTQSFNSTFASMLNTGSTALPWEPYTGGKPSPSPDYPQEIVSAGEDGNLNVMVRGKNIFPGPEQPKTVERNGLTFSYKDGMYTLTGTSNKDAWFNIYPVIDKTTSTTLTHNGNTICSDGKIAVVNGLKNKLCNIAFRNVDNKDANTSITASDNKKMLQHNTSGVFIYARPGSYSDTFTLMITSENQTEDYEPYHELQSVSVTTPNGLPGIPVSANGNYTDSNGQQWVCDELDFERGVYRQWIKHVNVVLEKVVSSGTHSGYRHIATGIKNLSRKHTECLCNIAMHSKDAASGTIEGIRASGEYNTIVLYYENLTDDNVPADVAYILSDPIETPLTAAEIAAYKSLRTYRGTTIVEAEDKAGISVTFKRNAKAAEKEVNILHADLMAEMEELDENSEIV